MIVTFTKYCAHVLACDRLVTKFCRSHQFNRVSEDSGSNPAIRGVNLAGVEEEHLLWMAAKFKLMLKMEDAT